MSHSQHCGSCPAPGLYAQHCACEGRRAVLARQRQFGAALRERLTAAQRLPEDWEALLQHLEARAGG